jgi:hypothetical protein
MLAILSATQLDKDFMKKIAVLSALMIFLSPTNADAKGCSSRNVSGRCVIADHPGKHATKKRPSMGSALMGAYQR